MVSGSPRERRCSHRHRGPQDRRGGRDPNRRDGSLSRRVPLEGRMVRDSGPPPGELATGLRPASRGSAKPAPMTLPPANVRAASSSSRAGCAGGSDQLGFSRTEGEARHSRRRRAESRIATSRDGSHSAHPQRVQWSRRSGAPVSTPAPQPAGWSDRHRPADNSHSGPLSPQPALIGEPIRVASTPDPEHVLLVTAPMFVEIAGERAPHCLGAGNALVSAHLRQPLGLLIGERDGRPHDV